MAKIVEVHLGEHRSVGFYEVNDLMVQRDDYVVVEVERGQEFGRVVSEAHAPCTTKVDKCEGKVLRVATEGDLKQIEHNRMKAKEALEACVRKVVEEKMDMQLVRAEYSFDNSKIIFFFVAEGRIDFRALVKDLAKIFKVRIELKQIGVRDKAKIVGGLGICGRELCCSSYMKGFHPLSIKMSKEQGLPLNPTRISGVCGRIKCCMAYEYSVYREYARALPRAGEKITTPDGKGKVIEVNVLKRFVHVDLGEGRVTKISFPKTSDN